MTESASAADRSALAALHAAWVSAVARGDATALRELLTDDYEAWAHGAPPPRGAQATAAAMAAAAARYAIEQHFEPLETVVAGDWAFARGLERVRITPRGGGESRVQEQRALLIMRRGADGRWRYARGMTNGPPPAPDPTHARAPAA
jgi:uncharacterized protein (TIGR02246 family)